MHVQQAHENILKSLSWKTKSKTLLDTTSYALGRLQSEKMEVNIGKNVEKLEPLDVAARNVKH